MIKGKNGRMYVLQVREKGSITVYSIYGDNMAHARESLCFKHGINPRKILKDEA